MRLEASEAETAPPLFVVQASDPEQIHFSYQRYVINQIRKSFGFEGVPIKVRYKTRRRRGDEEDTKKAGKPKLTVRGPKAKSAEARETKRGPARPPREEVAAKEVVTKKAPSKKKPPSRSPERKAAAKKIADAREARKAPPRRKPSR